MHYAQFYSIGLTLTKKLIYLKDATNINDETVYECLESALSKLDLTSCLSKCLLFSLPNQKLPQCTGCAEKDHTTTVL